jgi:HEPN domain-containing protein
VNRADLQTIAQVRLKEAQTLFQAGHHWGAYYLTGYAIECAFKAAISKQIKEHDFPDKKLVNDSYTHDLKKLLDTSGLKKPLEDEMQTNAALELNWSIVKDWSEEARYRHDITEPMARDLIGACTSDPDGVYLWLMKHW